MKQEVFLILVALGFAVAVISLAAWFACYVITKATKMFTAAIGLIDDDPPVRLGRHSVEASNVAHRWGLSHEIRMDILDALAREHAATKAQEDAQ